MKYFPTVSINGHDSIFFGYRCFEERLNYIRESFFVESVVEGLTSRYTTTGHRAVQYIRIIYCISHTGIHFL